MTPLTLQEVFTKAVLGFRQQNYVRSSSAGTCLYRGPDGAKCLIGHAIPDDKYEPKWDEPAIGGGVSSCWGDPNFRALFSNTDSTMQDSLSDLQLIHDHGYTVNSYSQESKVAHYETLFRKYATKHDLEYPEIQS